MFSWFLATRASRRERERKRVERGAVDRQSCLHCAARARKRKGRIAPRLTGREGSELHPSVAELFSCVSGVTAGIRANEIYAWVGGAREREERLVRLLDVRSLRVRSDARMPKSWYCNMP